MCGGMKISRTVANKKDEQIAKEMLRLARLKAGWTYTWPLSTGPEKHLFTGHARRENLDTVWNGKIARHVKIQAESFMERNTKGGNYNEMKVFSVPKGKGIHGIITKSEELRIVTQPAQGAVAEVHHRCPNWVDL